jgi:hypothetical protein
MTNPAPRPALRKAEDSSVHPAAPVRPARTRSSARAVPTQAADDAAPTRARSSATAAPASASTVSAAPGTSSATKPRRKAGKARAFSGATSDHLRPEAVVAAAEASARKAKKKKAQAFTDVDLMRGKTVDLEAQVPKRLRKAARDEAKRRGLDLDAVTTELLHRWLTGR